MTLVAGDERSKRFSREQYRLSAQTQAFSEYRSSLVRAEVAYRNVASLRRECQQITLYVVTFQLGSVGSSRTLSNDAVVFSVYVLVHRKRKRRFLGNRARTFPSSCDRILSEFRLWDRSFTPTW